PEIIIEGISGAIEHHHGDSASTEFEKIISFSDTMSSAERIPVFNVDFWEFCRNEVLEAPELFNLSEAIEIWKKIEEGNAPFEEISGIKNNKGYSIFPLAYEDFTAPILELKTKPKCFNEKCLCIFGGDVNSVKSFVKNSGKLKELRGSSYILRRIDIKIVEVFEKLLIPECLIYAKGGSFLSIIPNIPELYEKLRNEINKLYEDDTKGKVSTTIVDPIPFSFIELRFGQITQNYWADIEEISRQKNRVDQANALLRKYIELFNSTKTFGQLVKSLGNKIVENKVNRANLSTSFNYASKIFKLCSSCNEDLGIKKDGEDYLCETCVIKREINEKIKTNEYKDTFHYKICREYYNLTYDDAVKKFPLDLERIVYSDENKDKNLSDLIGFIMIDGNNFGAKLHRARTISEYKTISAELENLMVDLFLKAIKEKIDINKFKWAPFDIFYIGGDDIFCVINGYYVIDVLNEYHELIKNKLKNLDKYLKDKDARSKASIGFGAGVVFAKSRYPIKLAYDETDELESSAKLESKKSSDICPFYIDFHSQKYLAYKLEGNYIDPRPLEISKLYDIYSYVQILYNNLSKSLLYSLLGLHFKSGEIFTRAYIHYQAGKNPNKMVGKYLEDLLIDPDYKLYAPQGSKIIYRGSLYYELSKLIRPK
ncbi:MAG: Cas10/Cmr2 second palm domain-containing protein, partial [Candidatus Helarchaeota archaeon]